jgi:hypothetical protein
MCVHKRPYVYTYPKSGAELARSGPLDHFHSSLIYWPEEGPEPNRTDSVSRIAQPIKGASRTPLHEYPVSHIDISTLFYGTATRHICPSVALGVLFYATCVLASCPGCCSTETAPHNLKYMIKVYSLCW